MNATILPYFAVKRLKSLKTGIFGENKESQHYFKILAKFAFS